MQYCAGLIGRLEIVIRSFSTLSTRVKEVQLDTETALLDGASVMFKGQKRLIDMFASITSIASALLLGIRETEKARDGAGLRASHTRLVASTVALEVCTAPLFYCLFVPPYKVSQQRARLSCCAITVCVPLCT